MRALLSTLLVAFLSFVPHSPVLFAEGEGDTAPKEMPKDVYGAFTRLVEFGQAENAEEMLLGYLRSNPRDVRGLLQLSRHYLSGDRMNPKQSWELAVAAVSIAAEDPAFPSDHQTHFVLAQAAYMYAGTFRSIDAEKREALTSQAVENARVAIEKLEASFKASGVEPSTSELYRETGSGCAFLLGEAERSLAFQAKQKNDTAQQRTHLGNAFQHYKKALRYDPENRAVPLALASVLNDAHRGEEAEKVILEWEAKYRPTIETCDLGARSAYMRDGEPDYLAFARFLTRAAVISPSLENQVNASLAQRIGAITDPALRAEILRIHRSLIDNSVRPQDRAMFLGQWIPADGAEGQGVVVPEFCYLVADAHFGVLNSMIGMSDQQKLDKGEETLRLLGFCADMEETVPDVVRIRAMTLLILQRYAEARDAFSRLAELDPSDGEALLRVELMDDLANERVTIEVYEDLQDVLDTPMHAGERLDALKELVMVSPRFPLLRLVLGNQEYSLSHFEEAEVHFGVASHERPQSLSAWLGLGRSSMRLKKWPQALNAFQQALLVKPSSDEAQTWVDVISRIVEGRGIQADSIALVLNAQFQGNTQEDKLKLLTKALEESPAYQEAAIQAANLAQELGNQSEANRFGQLAIDAASSPSQKSIAYAVLGNLANLQGRYSDAFDAYNESIALCGEEDGRRSGLIWLAARSAFLNGDATQAHMLLNQELAKGVGFHVLQPDQESALFLPTDRAETRTETSDIGLDASTRLTTGSTMKGTLTFGVSVEGGNDGQSSPDITIGIMLHVDEAASSNGMFKLRVTLGTISEAPLAVAEGQILDLEVSPWFGIASSKWRDEEVAKTVAASRELLSLPLTTLLTETLCLVPSNDPLSIGQIWGRRMVDGKLHFDQDRDVCWIHEVTDSELTLGRRSALDWRERYEGGRHFPPRRLIDTRVVLDRAHGFPRETTVSSTTKRLVLEGRDVEIRKNHMHLFFE